MVPAQEKLSPAEELYIKAVEQMEKGEFEKAQNPLRNAIELDEDYAEAYYALAVCFVRKEKPEPALARDYHAKAVALGYQFNEWLDSYIERLDKQNN